MDGWIPDSQQTKSGWTPDGWVPDKSERGFKEKALDFLTMGHIYGEYGPENELTPEGKLDPRVQSGDPGFFQDPVTALGMGAVAGARAAAGPVGKALVAGREALGWLTGGASDVPTLVKAGAKGIVKAVEAKPLAELAAKRAGVQFAEVPIKMKAEEFLAAPASKIAAEVAPKIETAIAPPPAATVPPAATSGGYQG
ncbi:MAG: hypothetical protein U1D67_04745, partial [Dehalococcoidia bacterium]|nr:hypothetical protein [Dehalococcoidia bacterium]